MPIFKVSSIMALRVHLNLRSNKICIMIKTSDINSKSLSNLAEGPSIDTDSLLLTNDNSYLIT